VLNIIKGSSERVKKDNQKDHPPADPGHLLPTDMTDSSVVNRQ